MSLSNTTRLALLGTLSAAALMAAATSPAHAQDELIVVEQARATYLNGGIGKDDEDYMHKIAKDWSLRMIFSERKDNEFVTDVNLLVTDTRSTPYLQLNMA